MRHSFCCAWKILINDYCGTFGFCNNRCSGVPVRASMSLSPLKPQSRSKESIPNSYYFAFNTIPHHCDYRNSKFLRNHLIFSAEKWSFLRHSGSKEERGKGLFRILADLFIVAIMLHRLESRVSRLRSFKLGVWYKYQLRVIHIRCFSHYCHYKIR